MGFVSGATLTSRAALYALVDGLTVSSDSRTRENGRERRQEALFEAIGHHSVDLDLEELRMIVNALD